MIVCVCLLENQGIWSVYELVMDIHLDDFDLDSFCLDIFHLDYLCF